MNLNKSKKGLTPIIAVILLLMMTVAAAGAAFFWFIRIQGELQGGSEQFSQDLSQKVTSGAEFTLAEFTPTGGTGTLTILLKNTGAVPIPVINSSTPPTTTWVLQDNEQQIICNSDWAGAPAACLSGCGTDVGVASSATIVLNLTGACDISSDTTYPNETLFYTKIDFSGVTATGGSFTK